MHDDTSTPAAARPGASLLGGAVAACGAAAMGMAIPSLLDLEQTSHGHEVLIIWVLLGVAALGTLLCLYLTLIWGLAAMILLAGPASRTGALLLSPLRVLAPRLARRLTGGAVVATAATVLTLAPGMAAQTGLSPEPPAKDAMTISQTARLVSAELPAPEPAPEASAPDSSDPDTSAPVSGAPLPSLGWDGGSVPSSGTPPPAPTSGPDSSGAHSAGTGGPALSRTVIVHRGDSLWSISDDLLGPGASDPADIAAVWPQLHDANRGLIGADPDRLQPGQELTVPSTIISQDTP